MYTIIPVILVIMMGAYALIGMTMDFSMSATMGGVIIIAALAIFVLVFGGDAHIKELTVYQNGNIEIVDKNCLFGDTSTKRLSFTEYTVCEGDENKYVNSNNTIKLTPKYYKQYKDALKTEESMSIRIKD